MTFPRHHFVVFAIATILASLALRTNVPASHLEVCRSSAGVVQLWIQPSPDSGDITLSESAVLVPTSQTRELFADGSSGSLSLILIEKIRRTLSLDDINGCLNANACVAVRWRFVRCVCSQQLELLSSLSSLHVRLQV